MTARLMVFFMGIAIGFVFELKIIFERFATIYNITDRRMLEIDKKTKQLIKSGKKLQ